MIGVTENLGKIRDLLGSAARDAGRDPATVRLLAVSKQQPDSRLLAALAAGQREFGENTVQESLGKIARFAGQGIVWHFIGHLQSNKTRAVAEHFAWVHSVDREKVAERLGQQRPEELLPLNVCLQVNVDAEPAKSGVSPEGLYDLATAVLETPRLRLRGLMCLPAVREGFDEQRVPFRRLRELALGLADQGIETDTLSMGMSDDYRAAIFEGATIVRIGTAVFGPRTRKHDD